MIVVTADFREKNIWPDQSKPSCRRVLHGQPIPRPAGCSCRHVHLQRLRVNFPSRRYHPLFRMCWCLLGIIALAAKSRIDQDQMSRREAKSSPAARSTGKRFYHNFESSNSQQVKKQTGTVTCRCMQPRITSLDDEQDRREDYGTSNIYEASDAEPGDRMPAPSSSITRHILALVYCWSAGSDDDHQATWS